MYLRTLKAACSAKNFWEEIFMPKSQLGGILYIFPPGPRGGVSIFPLKHKSAMYTFVQQRGGGSRRDPNHKSMYKCAYMYVHLSLSPPGPAIAQFFICRHEKSIYNQRYFVKATHIFFYFPKFSFLSRKNESLLIIPLIKSTKFL